ncbi:hypothetical protein GCM10011506_30960 [Marivirga lumbricoides]|uniref:Uncharacterized protein n=1 Tax=Marivirga lumbricoides TaxID=1046115 RepID=A0ABQ1MM32_9BACT|nr:hypothetical protein GCM10011506_30960 [Marivirga lumbricoides]
MEAINHKIAKEKVHISDWEEVKSFYTCKGGVCNKCLLKFKGRESLLLPISGLMGKKDTFDAISFYKSITVWEKPVLFYHQEKSLDQKLLIKFTGNENFQPAIETLLPYLDKKKLPANIISPYSLSKSNRIKEHKLVLLTKQFFEPLGFIKLNLHSVADFHEFASEDKIGLLMLPLKDLLDYLQYAFNIEKEELLLPAIFQP